MYHGENCFYTKLSSFLRMMKLWPCFSRYRQHFLLITSYMYRTIFDANRNSICSLFSNRKNWQNVRQDFELEVLNLKFEYSRLSLYFRYKFDLFCLKIWYKSWEIVKVDIYILRKTEKVRRHIVSLSQTEHTTFCVSIYCVHDWMVSFLYTEYNSLICRT